MDGDGGGGEVVGVNIVYFLSRDGKVEHPHLIRAYYQRRRQDGGVRLRDVKKWLSEQRGKEMPDAFAWSYKRRYKTGYVWQDLKDDDLVTPISDCEYVLKGSWIPCSPSTPVARFDKVKAPTNELKTTGQTLRTPAASAWQTESDEEEGAISPRSPPRVDRDTSDERSAVFKIDMERHQVAERVATGESRSSTSGRASNVLCTIITCGLVETNDSALRRVDRRRDQLADGGGGGARRGGGGSLLQLQRKHYAENGRAKSTSNYKSSMKTGEKVVPAIYRPTTVPNCSTNSTNNCKSSTKTGEKVVPAIYRPTTVPNCSQCGKSFRPEKLHSHMKSCKGLRIQVNGGELKRMPAGTESCNQEYSKEAKNRGLVTH